MKVFQISILCSALALMMASCHRTSYQIQGSAEGLADGDTLYLTSDLQDGTPSATIIVKDGHFSYQGETDSVMLCMIYSAKHNEVNAPFFLEPGKIDISLSETPGGSRISGTTSNDEWQRLNDSVMVIGKKINSIAEHIYGNTVDSTEQQRGMKRIDELNVHFADVVVKAVERNIDNEFGYFLLTYYPEDLIDNANRQRLIEELPDKMRQRPAIQQLLETIKKSAKTAKGNIIPNFKQTTPEGSQLAVMDVVSQYKVTILDFWASWCGPCRQEMPFMADLYAKYHEQGLGMVGISLDQDKDAWLQAIKGMGMTWPQMSDLKSWENEAAQMFSITSIPHTIVVDQQGKILRRGLRGEDLEHFIAEQLK